MNGKVGTLIVFLIAGVFTLSFISVSAYAYCTGDACDNDAYKTDLNNGGNGVCHLKVNYYKKGTLYNDEAGTYHTDKCISSSVLREYYIECMGVGRKDVTHSIKKTCPSGYKCSNGACVEDDPCGGVTCNNKCVGDTRYYSGSCSGGSCYYSTQNCDNNYYYCSGNDRYYSNGYCSSGSCTSSTSFVEDCDDRDTSWTYECSGGCVKRERKDYSCSSGSCKSNTISENVACNGDGNYCSEKKSRCGTGCSYGQYDCDYNSECSSSAPDCVDYNGGVCLWGLECGCCNYGEKWDESGNKCIECSSKSDCGSDGWTGNKYCSNDNVYQNYKTYSCSSGSCSSSNEARIRDDCDDTYEKCSVDSCVEKTCSELGYSKGSCSNPLSETCYSGVPYHCDDVRSGLSIKLCWVKQPDCNSNQKCSGGDCVAKTCEELGYSKGSCSGLNPTKCIDNDAYSCESKGDGRKCWVQKEDCTGDEVCYDPVGTTGAQCWSCSDFPGTTGEKCTSSGAKKCDGGDSYKCKNQVTWGTILCWELNDDCAANEKCESGDCKAKTCEEQGHSEGSCLNLLNTKCNNNKAYDCNDIGNRWCWVEQETCTGGLCIDPPDPLQGAECYYCSDYSNTGSMCSPEGQDKCESGNPWECRDQIVSGKFLCWEQLDTCDQYQKCSGKSCVDLTCEDMEYSKGSCTGLDPTSCLDGTGGDAYGCQDKGHKKCWVKIEDCGTNEKCYDPFGATGAQCWSCSDFSGTTGVQCFDKYDNYKECRSGDVQVCNDQVTWGEILCWELDDDCASNEYCEDAQCKSYCGNGVCEWFEDHESCFKDCIPPLGNSDYCKWKDKYSNDCTYGEWDCDFNFECISGLDCVDYNGGMCLAGLECGCCNTDELWDSANNACAECLSDSNCPSDYCTEWEYTCTDGEVRKSKTCYDNYCSSGSCSYSTTIQNGVIARNGDWDYCDKKLDLCNLGCSHEEYDCDSNLQCMAGLDCMRQGGSVCTPFAECGCCNYGEKWDKSGNACISVSGCVVDKDCQEDNYANNLEYYCTENEVRERRLYYDYYCENNECKMDEYYRNEKVISRARDNNYCKDRQEHCGEKCSTGMGDCDSDSECTSGNCARGGWLDIFKSDYDYCCLAGQEWSGTECVGSGSSCQESTIYYCSGTEPGSDVIKETLESDCTKGSSVVEDCTESQLCNPVTLSCKDTATNDKCGYSGFRCEKGTVYACQDTGKGWKEETLQKICKHGYFCDKKLGECIITTGEPAILDTRWGSKSAMEGGIVEMIVETINVPDGADVAFYVMEADMFSNTPIDGERVLFGAGIIGQEHSITEKTLTTNVENNEARISWVVPNTIAYSGDFWSKPDLFFKAEIDAYGLFSVSEELDVIMDKLTDSRITINDLDDLFVGKDYLSIILPQGFEQDDISQLENMIVDVYKEYTTPWGNPAECEGAYWEGTVMDRRCCGCKYGNPHMNLDDIKIYREEDFSGCSDFSDINRLVDSNLMVLGNRETNKILDCFNRTSDLPIYIQKNPLTIGFRTSNRYAIVLNGENDVAYYISLMLSEFIGQAGEWRELKRENMHASWKMLKGFLPFIDCTEALESIDLKWSDVGWCAFDVAATILAFPLYKGAKGSAEGIKGVKKTVSFIKKGANAAEKSAFAKLSFRYSDTLGTAVKVAGNNMDELAESAIKNSDALLKPGLSVKQSKNYLKGMGSLAGSNDKILKGFEASLGTMDDRLKLFTALSKADELAGSADWIKSIKLHYFKTTNNIIDETDELLKFLDNFADDRLLKIIGDAGADLGIKNKRLALQFITKGASSYGDGLIKLNVNLLDDGGKRLFYVARHELGHSLGKSQDELIEILRKVNPGLADESLVAYRYYLSPLDEAKNNFDIFARMNKIDSAKAQTFLLKDKESLSGVLKNIENLQDVQGKRMSWWRAVAGKADAKNLKFRGVNGAQKISDDIDTVIRVKFGSRSNVDEIVAKFDEVSEEMAKLSRQSGEDIWGKAADKMIELYDFIGAPTPTSVGAVKSDFLAYNGMVVSLSGTIREGNSYHLWDGNESIEIEIPLLEDLDNKSQVEFLRYILNRENNVTAYVLYNESTGELKLVAEFITNLFLDDVKEENIRMISMFAEGEYAEIEAGPGEEGVVYVEIPENTRVLFAMFLVTAVEGSV